MWFRKGSDYLGNGYSRECKDVRLLGKSGEKTSEGT